MNNNYTPFTTAGSRVFIIPGRARPDHVPEYASSLKMSGLTQGQGDITPIEIPDPSSYGKFLKVASIRGQRENATTSLSGRYAMAVKSKIFELSNSGCAIDVQLHIGECTDPSDFDAFSKMIVLEDVTLTSYSTDDLGALGSDENAVVNETVELSSSNVYEILPLSVGTKADSIITNEITDIAIVDSASCGSCGNESDGTYKIFAVTVAAGGSPGTPPDILHTIDKGMNWYANDINSMLTAQSACGVAGVGDYIVAISAARYGMSYAPISEFDGGVTAPLFTEITTGFTSGKAPAAIWSNGRKAFIVASGGYIYYVDNVVDGVTAVDTGSATVNDLLAVHAYSEDFAVAVGRNGAVVYTRDRYNWTASPSVPVGAAINLTTVWMRDEDEWIVGTSDGRLFHTINAGVSWTQKSLPGTTPAEINKIRFANKTIGYCSAKLATPRGRVYRTFDGGYSWTVIPEKIGTMPLSDKFGALTCAVGDPNFFVTAGLADNGTDGILVIGKP